MKVIEIPIDNIIQDPSNARHHNTKNMEAIKGSIAKFGQVEPLIINSKTKVIIGGNGRHLAMKELGFEKVKVVEVDLNFTEATALGLALNRSAELAEWDFDTLGKLLHSLRQENFELGDIGFDTSYLDNILNLDQDVFKFDPDSDQEPDNDEVTTKKFEPKLPEEDTKEKALPTEFLLTVVFDNDDERQSLFFELRDRGLKVKV